MAKFNVPKCLVCGESSFSPFLNCTDFFVSGETFQIKKCDSCGFKITNSIEDEENISPYYQSEEYISHSNTSKGLVNSTYHQVRSFMVKQKRRLVQNTTGLKKGTLLDVGTGTGFFPYEMKKKGWQVTGTEKSEDARSFAKKEFDLALLPSEALFSLQEGQFDVITLWHVLEHIHQLDNNMITFSKLLNKKGKLIIAVPNHLSYDALHYREFWAAWDVPRHIWHFSPNQMKMFGERYGFKLASVHTMPFDSFYVSLLSEKYKKSKFSLVKGLFHGFISWFTSMFKPGKCSSVIYVFDNTPK